MKPIIKVENVSKQYRIGASEVAYENLREIIAGAVVAPFRWAKGARNGKPRHETIWALKGISFEIEPGEVVGIIGGNGAGKSTLLKLLSRITEPTTGRIALYGRIGSLLEVGTGFHPELTGRENIYLNGAILGMRRVEIARKFDEIVAFSEIARFIDTPVKYYSSGMYMRLAFAVAAHLEPEVLIVDEVLAVGDVSFQKKCLGKMGNVASTGRTVLFVSHNLIAVQSLCRRVLHLDQGRVVADGEPRDVVANYLTAQSGMSKTSRTLEEVWENPATAPGNAMVRLHRVVVQPLEESANAPLTMNTALSIEVQFWNLVPNAQLHVTLHLYTAQGIVAFTTGSANDSPWLGQGMPVGLFRCVCHVPEKLLNTGLHRFLLLIVKDLSSVIYNYESAVSFEIVDLAEREVSQYGREPGVVQPVLKWTTEYLDTADHAKAEI